MASNHFNHQTEELITTTKSIQEKLTPIRDIILFGKSILIWKKPYYSSYIVTSITLIFMILWLVEVPIISKLCFTGIIATLLDYFSPYLNAILASTKTENDEAEFAELCTTFAKTWIDVRDFYLLFSSWKTNKIKLYYSTILTVLMVIAWIGTQIHNLLLLYLLTLFVVLYPGLSHHNLIQQFTATVQTYTKSMFNNNRNSPKKLQ
ncbi:hypothetical protein NH340_JMT01386 [Sarcoptes scabiei]|nr:hypothetical protein NH340_JMT01386 [Sarcoptes scabiei]